MSDWKKSGQASWDRLATEDALWAVLTNRTKNDRDLRSFFVSGQQDVQRIFRLLDSEKITIQSDRALDYGCGVGRLSQALVPYFSQVTGVDVSGEMIARARSLNEENKSGVHFEHSTEFFESDERYDFILSLITLQHINGDHMPSVLQHLTTRLSDRGVLVVQIPSRPKGKEAIYQWVRNSPLRFLLRFYSHLKGFILSSRSDAASEHMEMNGLKLKRVKALLQGQGLQDIRVIVDDSAGPNWESYIYVARK